MRTEIVVAALIGLSLLPIRADIPHFFTTNLPQPDRAEVSFFPFPKPGSPNPVVKLQADAARTLASLVRKQSIGPYGMRCNNPKYAIRFYRENKLVASEAFCFGCHWIDPLASDIHAVDQPEDFDVTAPQARELANYFGKTLSNAAVVPH